MKKVFEEFFPKCKERLQGNGSDMLPYICSCRQWKYDFETEEYKIIKK